MLKFFQRLFRQNEKTEPPVKFPDATSPFRFVGALPPKETYYAAAQNAVEALQVIGFAGLLITTSGEDSSHMWTRAWHRTYTDLQEFLHNARNDFAEECQNSPNGPNPDWDTTRFQLQKDAVTVRIILPENDVPGHASPPPAARWVLTVPVDLKESETAQQALQLLQDLSKT
ncbi:MAG: hypothetical protein IKU17_09155 [Clostridia bacterium]|nr:hypothetical protein [Clostridia bacterium]